MRPRDGVNWPELTANKMTQGRGSCGARGTAPVADPTVGAELSFSAAFSVRQPARDNERGIGHRLPGDRNPPDSTGGLHPR